MNIDGIEIVDGKCKCGCHRTSESANEPHVRICCQLVEYDAVPALGECTNHYSDGSKIFPARLCPCDDAVRPGLCKVHTDWTKHCQKPLPCPDHSEYEQAITVLSHATNTKRPEGAPMPLLYFAKIAAQMIKAMHDELHALDAGKDDRCAYGYVNQFGDEYVCKRPRSEHNQLVTGPLNAYHEFVARSRKK